MPLPCSFRHLNTCFPVGGAVWEGVRRCDLVGGSKSLSVGFECRQLHQDIQFALSASSLQLRLWSLISPLALCLPLVALPACYSRVPFLLQTKVNPPVIHLGSWGFIRATGIHCGRNHCPHCVLSQEAERAEGWAQVLFSFPSSPGPQSGKWFHPPCEWVFPSWLILSR